MRFGSIAPAFTSWSKKKMDLQKEMLEIVEQTIDGHMEPKYHAPADAIEEHIGDLLTQIEDLRSLIGRWREDVKAPEDRVLTGADLEEIDAIIGKLAGVKDELDGQHTKLLDALPGETVVDLERLKELEADLIWSEVRSAMGLHRRKKDAHGVCENPHEIPSNVEHHKEEISPTFFDSRQSRTRSAESSSPEVTDSIDDRAPIVRSKPSLKERLKTMRKKRLAE